MRRVNRVNTGSPSVSFRLPAAPSAFRSTGPLGVAGGAVPAHRSTADRIVSSVGTGLLQGRPCVRIADVSDRQGRPESRQKTSWMTQIEAEDRLLFLVFIHSLFRAVALDSARFISNLFPRRRKANRNRVSFRSTRAGQIRSRNSLVFFFLGGGYHSPRSEQLFPIVFCFARPHRRKSKRRDLYPDVVWPLPGKSRQEKKNNNHDDDDDNKNSDEQVFSGLRCVVHFLRRKSAGSGASGGHGI